MRTTFWVYEPDTGANATTSAPTTPSTPAASPSPPASAPSVPSGGEPASSIPTSVGQTEPSAGATQTPPSWFEGLKQHGLPSGKDEAETIGLLKKLVEERAALESVKPYIPHVNQYLTNAQAFAKWRKEQQAKPQAEPAKEEPWWKPLYNPPEYNQSWEQHIQIGPDGKRSWAEGTPIEVQQKYQEYQMRLQENGRQLAANPYAFMEKAIDLRARKIVEEEIGRRMQQDRTDREAANFIKESAWLFEHDPQTGQRLMRQTHNPVTGQTEMKPVPSAAGQRFGMHLASILKEQESNGYRNDLQARQLAHERTHRDALIWQMQQMQQAQPAAGAGGTPAVPPPPVDPQAAANQAFLDKANPPGKAVGSGKGNVKPATETINDRNLERVFKKAMAEAGYN